MRSIRDRACLGAIFCAGLLSVESAAAAERRLVLEIVLNGRATGHVAEFIDRDSVLLVNPSDLGELGLVLPPALSQATGPIPLASLPNLSAEVDEARQTLNVVAGDPALQPTVIDGRRPEQLTPLTRAEFGALLNYDTTLTYAGHRVSGGGLFNVRAFGPFGVLENSALASIAPGEGQRRLARLDTTLTFTQASRLRRWRLGDVITGSLPWSRSVRLGGAQVASDFGVRPDLITYPLPELSSSAAVPSTVNVIVNGVNQLSEQVEAGPFVVATLPVVTGAGTVAVTMVDALGRQILVTMPFYASSALLKPGLASYSVEIGAVREDYSLRSDRYSGWAASQSSRLGVTEWLTLESHAEASRGLALVGAGGTMLVGTLGIVNVAVAGSTGHERNGSRTTGALVSAGFQRISPRLSFSASGTYASSGFSDIAAVHDAPVPKSTINANLGYQLGRWGNLGLAYNRRVSRRERGLGPSAELDAANPTIELVTGSYSVAIAGFSTLYATGFKDLGPDGAYGVAVGLNFAMGGGAFGTIEAALDDGDGSVAASVVKTVRGPGDFGYRARVSHGRKPRQSLEGEYLANWGRMSAGVDRSSGRVAIRGGASGALVAAGGGIFASDHIDDSFAVVSTGDIGGVPVMVENRPAGRTNARGKLLIPSLRSFEDNRLTVDSTLLPPDIEVGSTAIVVRPPDRSGVAVDFRIKRVKAALLTLHDGGGRALPLGSVVKVDGADDRPVGHDGAAYVTGLKPDNRVAVDLPDGTRCAVRFPYQPVAGDIPLIGPLSCR